MNKEKFGEIVDDVFTQCQELLNKKGVEYYNCERGRLVEFKAAAALRNETPRESLAGMMVKHTVKLYSMIDDGNNLGLAKWEEIINDHINYLILLKAILIDEGDI